jgi:hypothetical protein
MQAASFTGIVRLCDVLIQTLQNTIASAELIDAEGSEPPDVNRVGPCKAGRSGGWIRWQSTLVSATPNLSEWNGRMADGSWFNGRIQGM